MEVKMTMKEYKVFEFYKNEYDKILNKLTSMVSERFEVREDDVIKKATLVIDENSVKELLKNYAKSADYIDYDEIIIK